GPTGSATASASRRRSARPPRGRTRCASSPPGAGATGCSSACARVGFRGMLEGKRVFITGGAGFIATTLARELVGANEVVALSGTDLAEHPNFTFHQGDVLDGALLAELARGATHVVHCAAIAGVETV